MKNDRATGRKISPAGNLRPLVIAHMAMTVDGKTSTRAFTPARFTSSADKARLQMVRTGADAILAGRRTVEVDQMSMGISREDLRRKRVRLGLPPVPLRVLVSNAGNLNPDGKVFAYPDSPLIVFSTRRMPPRIRSAVAQKAELYLFDQRTVDLPVALQILRGEFGVKRLVCEGGGTLLRTLATQDLVDRLFVTLAPKIFGGGQAPTLTGLPGVFFTIPLEFQIARQSVLNGECFLELERKR